MRFVHRLLQVTLQEIESKRNRLQTIVGEATDLNDLQLAANAKHFLDQFDDLQRDLTVNPTRSVRRQRFTNSAELDATR